MSLEIRARIGLGISKLAANPSWGDPYELLTSLLSTRMGGLRTSSCGIAHSEFYYGGLKPSMYTTVQSFVY